MSWKEVVGLFAGVVFVLLAAMSLLWAMFTISDIVSYKTDTIRYERCMEKAVNKTECDYHLYSSKVTKTTEGK